MTPTSRVVWIGDPGFAVLGRAWTLEARYGPVLVTSFSGVDRLNLLGPYGYSSDYDYLELTFDHVVSGVSGVDNGFSPPPGTEFLSEEAEVFLTGSSKVALYL